MAETERELAALEAALKQLEAEYTMYFSGRLARPPLATRSRVQAEVKRLDRAGLQNYGLRFRFLTLQTRFASLVELWDRGLRSREEGRAGPFAPVKSEGSQAPKRAEDRVLLVAAFRDPLEEMDKLRDLHRSLVEAQREVGADAVPFQRFAEVVKAQVEKVKASGGAEVAFRIAVEGGKVSFTVRAPTGETE